VQGSASAVRAVGAAGATAVEPVTASVPPRREPEVQARSSGQPTDSATEWSLPSQLLTVPGDLWTQPGQAAIDARNAR
jgi:hypothetical protein